MASWNYAAGWIGLFIAAGFYFYFIVNCGNAVDKRKWFPYLTIIINFLALALALWTLGGWAMFGSFLLLPLFSLSSFIMIKWTKFCDSCGSAATTYMSFRNVKCCPKCNKQFAISKI